MTEPAPPPSSGDLEKDRDRRHAVGLALFGLIGIVLGGIIAAGSAYYTANIQASSQSSQSQRDFQRQQRQVVFSKFISDEQDMVETERRITTTLASRLSATTQTISQEGTVSNNGLKLLQTDLANIELIASINVVEAALNLVDAHTSVIRTLTTYPQCFVSRVTNKGCAVFIASYKERQRTIGLDEITYVALARGDLGIA